MPLLAWKKNPVEVAQRHEAKYGNTPLGPLLLWAMWAVDGLQYLEDLDHVQVDYPNDVNGHHPDAVDIAHVRWATNSAVTALDLCAAILGRVCCASATSHELDLRDFDPNVNSTKAAALRTQLPSFATTWIDNVLADCRYKAVQEARNPMTHSWMSRHLQRGANNGHASRTAFRLKKSGTMAGARQLVEDSRILAATYVQDFLDVVDQL